MEVAPVATHQKCHGVEKTPLPQIERWQNVFSCGSQLEKNAAPMVPLASTNETSLQTRLTFLAEQGLLVVGRFPLVCDASRGQPDE
jgi:hypothetical protein